VVRWPARRRFIATGCGSEQDSGPTGEDRGGVPSEGDAFPAAGETLFEDSFDDDRNNWGVVDDPEFGSAAYANGDYVWEFRGRVAHWIAGELGDQYDRGELAMLDVVVRAEATIVEGGGVIGVSCRETPDTNAEWQWYEFVARGGFAAIRRADDQSNIDVLAMTDDVNLPIGDPIAIEGACIDDAGGDVQLWLTINGAPVLQATDSDPLGNGVPGLQAWTYPAQEQMDVRWHDFSVHRPDA
jgi:hypothetical protein